MDNKEALSGLTLGCWPPSNRKSPLRAGPCTPVARHQKKPSQGWPSCALYQAQEKALTGAISLVPMAFGTPGAPTIQAVIPPLCPVLTGADPSALGQPQEQAPVGGPQAKVRVKPELNPRDRVTKEEDRKSFHQLHKLQIKSL